MTAPHTAADIVTSFEGRERTGLAVCAEATAKLKQIIETRFREDAQALGLEDPLAPVGAQTAPTPARKRRATVELPDAPPDDYALLAALVEHLKAKRATAKGLAAKFTRLTPERVYEVLIAENAKVNRRVKLEPNGRTWVAVSP